MEEMNSSEISSDGRFRVVYYPETSNEQLIPMKQEVKNLWPMERLTGAMNFEMVEESATISFGEESLFTDLGYEYALELLTPELIEEAEYNLSDCSNMDEFCWDFGNWGCKIGGHPSIRQGDIRLDKKEYEDYSILLFQLDFTSQEELEADTFSFFIKPEDLNACRFDDILLGWHNCF